MKLTAKWRSDRLGQDVRVVRWGEIGTPVLLFPTAGGDAEEVERFLVIDALGDLLKAGRIKVFSCDSVAGRAWVEGQGSDRHRSWVQNQFHEFVRYEMVPAIRNDCHSSDIGIIAAGASIGAFNALAVLCRFPDAFTKALCLSGTYDLTRFLKNGDISEDFYYSSPLHFLPGLSGPLLDAIRSRFVLLASGQGRAEDIGESWRAASVLGGKGIPNRVDAWGEEWHHDWPTWRRMLPQYLAEMA
ncbi:MAG TPA: alpha/beta hydrolase-fold protein [Candidatus Sulfotelmatobacter sp.]|nr:alpha/beta hydrolase-fold protein [Candidatus Sulfotelmatobacter sp.]